MSDIHAIQSLAGGHSSLAKVGLFHAMSSNYFQVESLINIIPSWIEYHICVSTKLLVIILHYVFSRMWWTITGNFGNILPIDWSKSQTHKVHLSVLGIEERDDNEIIEPKIDELSSEDEAVAHDLDFHSMILNGINSELEKPIKSAEEVIKEIDDIMDESEETEDESSRENPAVKKAREFLGLQLYEGSKFIIFRLFLLNWS